MKRIAAVIAFTAVILPLGAETVRERLLKQGLGVVEKPLAPVDFELEDASGAKVKLSSLKGRVVFLNFWATWCGPCASEMPSMQRLYAALKADGLEILAVNLREDRGTVKSFAKRLDLAFPILFDADGRVGGIYNANYIPLTYLLDRDGNIFARSMGTREWDTPEMMETFRRILAEGVAY